MAAIIMPPEGKAEYKYKGGLPVDKDGRPFIESYARDGFGELTTSDRTLGVSGPISPELTMLLNELKEIKDLLKDNLVATNKLVEISRAKVRGGPCELSADVPVFRTFDDSDDETSEIPELEDTLSESVTTISEERRSISPVGITSQTAGHVAPL